MSDDLTTKQKLFVEAYLKNPNATEAARKAGYKGNDKTLSVVGAENLAKPLIAEQMELRMAEVKASTIDSVTAQQHIRKVVRTLSKKGFVYLIRADNGLVKIGLARNVARRFESLRCASPCDLTLVTSIASENAQQLEYSLHQTYKAQRVRGEWFSLTDADVEDIKRQYESGDCQSPQRVLFRNE